MKRGLLVVALMYSATAQAQGYLGKPPVNGGSVKQETVEVLVPSYRRDVLRGNVPSTAVIEVPGRQLHSPLETALGIGDDPAQQVQAPLGFLGLQNSNPSKGTVPVLVPSFRRDVLEGNVPSTAVIEVPGRQLYSPLEIGLGYDKQLPLDGR